MTAQTPSPQPPSRIRALVLYDSHGPALSELASAVAEGIRGVSGAAAVIRDVSQTAQEDLLAADALVLGSPNWTGITGFMKSWLDEQGDLWLDRRLEGKVGAAFAMGRGRHSGLEFTLLSLLHWMLAGGMIVVGLPFNEDMDVSGSYYGATAAGRVQPQDLGQARVLGQRVAETALSLKAGRAARHP